MKKYNSAFLLFITSCFSVFGQDLLTLEQAIETALKNNYSISVARLQANIAENNNNIGNAGFLPTLSLNGSASSSSNNTVQEFSTGASVNRTGALSSSLIGGVALNWTIFDGLKMFATKEKLNELEEQGVLNLKMEIENNIVKITSAYYDVVRQQQLIRATNEAIKIYEERAKIAQLKLNIGSASKMDLLQTKVDLNAQKSQLLKQNNALDNAKASLNQLLSKNIDNEFFVNEKIIIDYQPVYTDLQKALTSTNTQLLAAQKNINIASSTTKELNGLRLPQVGLSALYNFSENKNQVGLILLNRNLGLNTGITASWTLFNGYKNQTQLKSVRLAEEQSKLQFKYVNSQLESMLYKSFKVYLNSLEALKLEEENSIIAKENVTIALERYRLGNANTIELMTAQKSYEDALSRVIDARYEAKIAETELKKLEGTLVK